MAQHAGARGDSGPLLLHQARVEVGSWEEAHPTALCRDDQCPWKYVGTSLWRTQRRAEQHALSSGHEVTIYRDLRRTVKRDPGGTR